MRVRDSEAGFSVPELLVAVLLLSFVILGLSTVFVSNQKTFERGQVNIESQQNARVGLEMLARELRMAGYDPLDQISLQATPSVFQVATADTLTFLADLNGDDTLDQVTYRWQGGRLVREFSSWDGTSFASPASSTVAEGVSGFSFAYADGTLPTNNTLAAPVTGTSLWDIRRVMVALQTQATTVDGLGTSFDLVIDVRPRNLV